MPLCCNRDSRSGAMKDIDLLSLDWCDSCDLCMRM